MSTIDNHPRKVAAGSLAAGTILAATLISGFEGLRTHAYLDPTGTATVCYGETAGVKLGQVRSREECLNLLSADVQGRVPAMQRCLKHPVSPVTSAWMISYGYNVGVGRFCRSVAPLANAGRLEAACNAMRSPTTSKGVALPGLVSRRKAEAEGCLRGLV